MRRLQQLFDGEFHATRYLIAELPAALEMSKEAIEEAIEASRSALAQQDEAEWRGSFIPHAILETEHRKPTQLFVVALIGVNEILRIDFDPEDGPATYLPKALNGIANRLKQWGPSLPGFGRPTGFLINFSPDEAVRYTLEGQEILKLSSARKLGEAKLTFY